ncbi:MAG: hypothetical protein KC917_19855 [Candidatus Omnitrophica bacterium]|nr:hypothetical protein [Candidatus Omnitrophota bacterium]
MKRMEAHLAWIALFQSERDRDSFLSWNILAHSEEDLQTEIGRFCHQFLQIRDTLLKQPARTRKKWEIPLERLWKRFQGLIDLHQRAN